jgi:PST family polysaccharide transporter
MLFLFFLGAGNILAGILSVIAARRIFKLKFIPPKWQEIMLELKEGWHITTANLSSFTCQYSNVLILRVFTNDLVVGYYSIAERIFFTIRQVLGIFSQAIYPVVCQLVQKGREQLVQFFKTVYLPFLLSVCSGAIILFIFAPQVLYFPRR